VSVGTRRSPGTGRGHALAAAAGVALLAASIVARAGPLPDHTDAAFARPGASAQPAATQTVQATGRPVAAGVRLMYYASSASVRGVRSQFVWRDDCDPAIEECWVDPSTGRIAGADVEVPTPAGAGYTQVDVLYVDDTVCVGRVVNHLVDIASGALLTRGGSAFVSSDGCLDYWTPPERLQALAGQATTGLRVRRGPYTLAGQTFDALSVTSTGAAGSSHSAYDALSGLLVVATSRTQGAAVPTIGGDGTVRPGAGGSLLTYSQLLGVKTVDSVPPQGPLPPDVARVAGLTYACSITTAMPGAPPLQVPCRQDAEVVERAPGWLLLRVVRQQANVAGLPPEIVEASEVITAGGVGGPYAAAPWLRSLAPGALLDDDAITGIRVVVTHVDDATVVIAAESTDQRATYAYDRGSGWLRTLVVEQGLGASTTTVRLDLQEVR